MDSKPGFSRGIVGCTLPTKVPHMVNPYISPIPWYLWVIYHGYTLFGGTPNCSLSFRDTTKPRGASQNDPNPLHWKMFFCQPKGNTKKPRFFCADPMCRKKTSIELWFLHTMLQVSIGNYFCIWNLAKNWNNSKTWNNSLNTFL